LSATNLANTNEPECRQAGRKSVGHSAFRSEDFRKQCPELVEG